MKPIARCNRQRDSTSIKHTSYIWSDARLRLLQLITLMFGSIDYLTKKATFKQVSERIPITQEIPDAETPETFEGALFSPSQGQSS